MSHCHVLYTADHSYFPHMMTSVCSLLENNTDSDFTIHVIEDHFTEEDFQKLYRLFSIYSNSNLKVYQIEKVLRSIYQYHIPKWRNTDVASARLFSNEVIDGVDKILYLDCDTIVVGSIQSLLDTRLKMPVAMVKELSVPNHIEDFLKNYYNSGVLLFDYTLWESFGCSRKLYDNAKKYRDVLKYPSQDLLNLSCQHMICTLSPNYNIHPTIYYMNQHPVLSKAFYQKYPNYYSLEELNNSFKMPCILHSLEFMNLRVWDDNSIHPFNSFYEKYRNLWDPNFSKLISKSTNAKMKSMVYLKLAADSFLSESAIKKVKSKCRKFGINGKNKNYNRR